MRFRFEANKPSEIENNIFGDLEFPTNLRVIHEFEMSEATAWDNIMLQFGKFLDATGYCGVYERISTMLENDGYHNNLESLDEDIGNSGLSD